jgi:hypothetical protein
MANGTSSFPATTLSSSSPSFGAVLITPGRTYQSDMQADDQQAVLSANAQGTGVVFTDWTSYMVTTEHFYAQLAPLDLLQETTTGANALTFALTTANHPIWTGLPTTFTSTAQIGFVVGSVINGGTAIATLAGPGATPSPGVIVRDSQTTAGRVVHIGHAANYNGAGWQQDSNVMLMLTNALKWAARCL